MCLLYEEENGAKKRELGLAGQQEGMRTHTGLKWVASARTAGLGALCV